MAQSVDNFNDLTELGIDLQCNDSLTDVFNKAAEHLPSLLPNVDNQILLLLYGYYKQATEGPCNSPKPSWYDMKAKSKWEAWNKLGLMPQNEAKTNYINTIKKLDQNFITASKESWVSVSVFKDTQPVDKSDKTIFDYVRDDDSSRVLEALKSISDVNKIDDDGLGLIHWAADRGSLEVLGILIDEGADINLQDSDGQTALHYACSCGHIECVELLLSKSATKDVLDNDGFSPYDVACDEAVKELLQ